MSLPGPVGGSGGTGGGEGVPPTTDAGDITSGIFAPARLGSGTPSAANYLRGDGAWAAIAAALSLTYFERKGGVTLGSTNTTIVRYATPVWALGGALSETDSASLGTYFTVNTAGLYIVWVMARFSALKSVAIRHAASVHNGALTFTSETDLRTMATGSDGVSSCGVIKAAAGDKIWVALSGAGAPSNQPDLNRIAILGPLPLAS